MTCTATETIITNIVFVQPIIHIDLTAQAFDIAEPQPLQLPDDSTRESAADTKMVTTVDESTQKGYYDTSLGRFISDVINLPRFVSR